MEHKDRAHLYDRVVGIKISGEAALATVRDHAVGVGWSWEEPVISRRWFRRYRFWTNAENRGGNVVVDVDGRSGDVIGARILPR